jgi:hypothetical protein
VLSLHAPPQPRQQVPAGQIRPVAVQHSLVVPHACPASLQQTPLLQLRPGQHSPTAQLLPRLRQHLLVLELQLRPAQQRRAVVPPTSQLWS